MDPHPHAGTDAPSALVSQPPLHGQRHVLHRASASSCEMELSSLNDLLSCSNMSSIKIFFQHKRLFFDSTITPATQLGLWTLRPRCSAVLPHPEPTIDFSHWSAVSHPKPRDFRFRDTSGDVTSGSGPLLGATLSTNQKPGNFLCGPPLLLLSSLVSCKKAVDEGISER